MTVVNDMNEKLNEAKYHFNIMKNAQSNGTKEEFTYAFSAFLTSIRNVTQYAYEYKQQAYDLLIPALKYKKIFTELRNENIHSKPIKTSNAGQSSINMFFTISGGENETNVLDDNEKIDHLANNEYYYIFEGQFDTPEYRDKTLIELTNLYINEIEKFISDYEKLI